MEIDSCKDEDLGICIADEDLKETIQCVGRFLIITVPIIVSGLILLMVKSFAP